MSQSMGLWLNRPVDRTPALCVLSQVRQLHLSGREPSSPRTPAPLISHHRMAGQLDFSVCQESGGFSPPRRLPLHPTNTCSQRLCHGLCSTQLNAHSPALQVHLGVKATAVSTSSGASCLGASSAPCLAGSLCPPPSSLAMTSVPLHLGRCCSPALLAPPPVRPTLTPPSSPPHPPWTYLPSQRKPGASPQKTPD